MKLHKQGHKRYSCQLGLVILILGAMAIFLDPLREYLSDNGELALVFIGALQAALAYIKQNTDGGNDE